MKRPFISVLTILAVSICWMSTGCKEIRPDQSRDTNQTVINPHHQDGLVIIHTIEQSNDKPMLTYNSKEENGRLSTEIDFDTNKLERVLNLLAPWAFGIATFLLILFGITTTMIQRGTKSLFLWLQLALTRNDSYFPDNEQLPLNDQTMIMEPQPIQREDEELTISGSGSSHNTSPDQIDALRLEGAMSELCSRMALIERKMDDNDASLVVVGAETQEIAEKLVERTDELNQRFDELGDQLEGLQGSLNDGIENIARRVAQELQLTQGDDIDDLNDSYEF